MRCELGYSTTWSMGMGLRYDDARTTRAPVLMQNDLDVDPVQGSGGPGRGRRTKTGAIRIVVTEESAAEFARLRAERSVVSLTGRKARDGSSTTRRSVTAREIYELVICNLLDSERAGHPITVLYPPESAHRQLVWIASDIKVELEAAARRLDVSVPALFFTATVALLKRKRAPAARRRSNATLDVA